MRARKLRVALFVASIGVAACSTSGSHEIVVAEVPSKYRKVFEGFVENGQDERVWSGFPYDTIHSSRWCVWPGSPSGDVVFHRGGRAELKGEVGGKWGDFEGEIDLFSYGRLCYAFEQADFERLRDRYSNEGFDTPESTFEVTWRGGSKRVVDHGEVGPIELWTLGAAIDGVRSNIRWKPVKK